jgi:hypothetical protein
MAICSKCGVQIPEGAQFCPACGTPVNNAAQESLENPEGAEVKEKQEGLKHRYQKGCISSLRCPGAGRIWCISSPGTGENCSNLFSGVRQRGRSGIGKTRHVGHPAQSSFRQCTGAGGSVFAGSSHDSKPYSLRGKTGYEGRYGKNPGAPDGRIVTGQCQQSTGDKDGKDRICFYLVFGLLMDLMTVARHQMT